MVETQKTPSVDLEYQDVPTLLTKSSRSPFAEEFGALAFGSGFLIILSFIIQATPFMIKMLFQKAPAQTVSPLLLHTQCIIFIMNVLGALRRRLNQLITKLRRLFGLRPVLTP